MNTDLMSLDELYAAAKQAFRENAPAKEPKALKIGGKYAAPPSELFTNEKNWHPLRIVALMHEESQTFLGNFEEFEHNTVKDARKMKRLVGVTVAGRVDIIYVSGPGYLEYHKPESNTFAPDLTRLSCSTLELDSPPVAASEVLVCVHRSNGGITRIALEHETVFYSRETLLTLPQGTDILPSLSTNSKKLIKGML